MRSQQKSRVRNSSRALEEAARGMRRALTPTEARLWEAVRERKCGGLKFRRQHPVGRFVLDFYCAEARLVLEVDGAIHEQQHERDEARTQVLEQHGLRVLRVSNEQVMHDLPHVIERIIEEARVDEGKS